LSHGPAVAVRRRVVPHPGSANYVRVANYLGTNGQFCCWHAAASHHGRMYNIFQKLNCADMPTTLSGKYAPKIRVLSHFQTADFRGKVILTTRPRASVRFCNSSEPPCATAIWRASTSPMPLPVGFVV